MDYNIRHITNKAKLQTKAFRPQYLTIHSTANTASAQNERDNLNRPANKSQVSFHVVVDDKQAIECLPLNMRAWHAGTQTGNNTSIGLEICEGGDRQKTLLNAAETTARVLKQFGWGTERLRQHNDWSGKDCPRILRNATYRKSGHHTWEWFKEEVQRRMGNKYSYDDTVDRMIIDGVTTVENMAHWEQVLAGKIKATPEQIRAIIQRYQARS